MICVTSCLVRFEVHSVMAASTASWFWKRVGPSTMRGSSSRSSRPIAFTSRRQWSSLPREAEDVAPVVEPARRALVEAAGRGADDAVAAARQLVLARGLAAHRRAAVVQHRVAHGDLDVLAAAGRHALIERGEDAHGAQHAGAGIADGRARPDRRLVGMAVHAHRAAHRLGDHVEGTDSSRAGSPARSP